MNSAFLTPETVRAEMQARYGLAPVTPERPAASLHVVRRVRARVLAVGKGR